MRSSGALLVVCFCWVLGGCVCGARRTTGAAFGTRPSRTRLDEVRHARGSVCVCVHVCVHEFVRVWLFPPPRSPVPPLPRLHTPTFCGSALATMALMHATQLAVCVAAPGTMHVLDRSAFYVWVCTLRQCWRGASTVCGKPAASSGWEQRWCVLSAPPDRPSCWHHGVGVYSLPPYASRILPT